MSYERIDVPSGYEFAFKRSTDQDWIDMGPTANDATGTFESDGVKVTSSTGTILKNFRKNARINLTLSFYQRYLEKIAAVLGGYGTYSTVAAAPVSVIDEDYAIGAWAVDTFIPFAHQNGAGTVPTSISVVNGSTPLVADTDYFVMKSGMNWGIMVKDTATVDPAADLELNYTYTPAAKEVINVGAASITLTPYQLRIRKPLGSGKYETMTIYSVTSETGLGLNFQRHDADDVDITEVSLVGEIDTTRTEGEQLFTLERDI